MSVPQVPVYIALLFESDFTFQPVDLRINVTVDLNNIQPTIVVEISEPASPPNNSGIARHSGLLGSVGECPVAVVLKEIGGLERKVCLENVQPAIAIIVSGSYAHSRLGLSVTAECASSQHGYIAECAIVHIAKQSAGRCITRQIDIGPTIVIKVIRQ